MTPEEKLNQFVENLSNSTSAFVDSVVHYYWIFSFISFAFLLVYFASHLKNENKDFRGGLFCGNCGKVILIRKSGESIIKLFFLHRKNLYLIFYFFLFFIQFQLIFRKEKLE
jgi:hypothetical protein